MKKYSRPISLIIMILWMMLVFYFSNQPANTSGKMSGTVAQGVIDSIPTFSNRTQEEKLKLAEEIEVPIRKLTHFSIYALGGIFVINYINTYSVSIKRKMQYSMAIGVFYAFTDEFHQLFVVGRSCELRDVLIDSLGVLLGISIFAILYYKNKKKKEGETNE